MLILLKGQCKDSNNFPYNKPLSALYPKRSPYAVIVKEEASRQVVMPLCYKNVQRFFIS